MKDKKILLEEEMISAKTTLQKAVEAWKKYRKKFIISYSIFIILNIIVIIMSSLMIVFNLYSLRLNNFPHIQGREDVDDSIWYLIAIAIGSALTTFLTSITSFFSFNEKRVKLLGDIKILSDKLEEFKNKPIEDLNEWVANISDYGDVL